MALVHFDRGAATVAAMGGGTSGAPQGDHGSPTDRFEYIWKLKHISYNYSFIYNLEIHHYTS